MLFLNTFHNILKNKKNIIPVFVGDLKWRWKYNHVYSHSRCPNIFCIWPLGNQTFCRKLFFIEQQKVFINIMIKIAIVQNVSRPHTNPTNYILTHLGQRSQTFLVSEPYAWKLVSKTYSQLTNYLFLKSYEFIYL